MSFYLSIKENREFQRVYARGKPFVGPELISYVMKNRKNTVRFGITTSKKTGNAVKRNRSRRLIRESFRLLAGEIKPGYDFIFVARTKTSFLKCCDISQAMRRQLKNAGVLK